MHPSVHNLFEFDPGSLGQLAPILHFKNLKISNHHMHGLFLFFHCLTYTTFHLLALVCFDLPFPKVGHLYCQYLSLHLFTNVMMVDLNPGIIIKSLISIVMSRTLDIALR